MELSCFLHWPGPKVMATNLDGVSRAPQTEITRFSTSLSYFYLKKKI